ncbi:MAG: metallophosphoesterase [Cellulosilyticaceae bacterium]
MIKNILKGIIGLLMIGLILYYYMVEIEPQLLKVSKYQINSFEQKMDMKGLKVVQFTDTHLGEFFKIEDMKKVINRINELQPDIVVFTGDLVDYWENYEEDMILQKLLEHIQAPLGKFAVFGNHDYGSSGYKIYEKFMEEAGFKVLVNEVYTIHLGDGRQINVAGLDDALLGKPDVDEIIKYIDVMDYNILLMHEPDWIEKVPKEYIDLQLSGHSHGGQVSLPKITERILPKYGMKYVQGMYKISERTQLYVNTGLGSTKVPFRLGNIPEISFFEVD